MSDVPQLPASRSQGLFPFGRDCAAAELRNTARKILARTAADGRLGQFRRGDPARVLGGVMLNLLWHFRPFRRWYMRRRLRLA